VQGVGARGYGVVPENGIEQELTMKQAADVLSLYKKNG
jgi:hypothetical protein